MSKEVQHYWHGESSQWILDNNKDDKYVDPEILYALKAAHCNWDIHWNKTVSDIIFFHSHGVELKKDLYDRFLKDFRRIHGDKWAKLKGKDATSFFEDAVKRKYVHDSIHEAVAYYDKPLYERILSGRGVECSKEKFDNLSFDDKIKLVREEIFVTALERFIIPNNFFSKHRAYYLSLKKLATTMSSGWFSFFIISNLPILVRMEDDYVTKFKQNQDKLIYDH